MKNKNWKKATLGLALILLFLVGFGGGYAMGAYDTAEFIFEKFLDYFGEEGLFENITIADLMKYYLQNR